MDVTVSPGEGDDAVTIEIGTESDFVPEVASDLLRRAADTTLRCYHDLHPATDPG